MGCSIPSTSWNKTAPMATSEACMVKKKGWPKYGGLRIGWVANLDFKSRKARSVSAVQTGLKGQQKYGQNEAQTYGNTQPNLETAGVAYGWWGRKIQYSLYLFSPRLHTTQTHVVPQIVDFSDCKTTLGGAKG